MRGEPEADDPPGLFELLTGAATFDQAIHLDRGSRLHLLTCGAQDAVACDGLDVVLEALSQTYDYVILLAPAVAQDTLTLSLAPLADFVILACSAQASDPSGSVAYAELRRAGDYEILAIAVEPAPQDPVRDVA